MNAHDIAQTHWETRWIAAEGVFDPAYERTTAALRRWVEGMEEALTVRLQTAAATTGLIGQARRRAG